MICLRCTSGINLKAFDLSSVKSLHRTADVAEIRTYHMSKSRALFQLEELRQQQKVKLFLGIEGI